MPDTRYPDVEVQLTGQDGNAFAIIGAVSKALRQAEGAEVASEWSRAAMDSGSYDDLLRLAMSWVEVA